MNQDNLPMTLAQNSSEIKGLRKQVAEDVVKIGKLLTESKAMMSHGDWVPWLENEFGWSNNTALNFMQVHAMVSKNAKFADLNLPISSLYLLAKPSTTEEAKTEIIDKAKTGKGLKHKDIKQIVYRNKSVRTELTKVQKEPEPEIKPVVSDQEKGTPNICAECAEKDKKIDSLERQILGYKRNMTEDQLKISELEKKLELFFIIKRWAENNGEWDFLVDEARKFDKHEDE